MPTVFRWGKWRFHFYSDEGAEPPHIHVDAGGGACKFWLQPVVLARSRRLPAVELRRIERVVLAHEMQLVEAWHEFFGA